MWGLIVLVPDHCWSFYFGYYALISFCSRMVFHSDALRAVSTLMAVLGLLSCRYWVKVTCFFFFFFFFV